MSFSHSSLSIELVRPSALTARCRNHAAALVSSSLDLDAMLGNQDGDFQPGGSGALKEASRAWLEGSVLCAMLPSLAGVYTAARIDLDELVTNHDGHLSWVDMLLTSRPSTPHKVDQHIDLPIPTDIPWSTERATPLSQSLSVRLANRSVICAEISAGNGEIKELFFDLNQLLLNVNGDLVLSFNLGHGGFGSSASHVELNGTILIVQLYTISWGLKDNMIDLDHVLAIEDGRLVLNRSGPGCAKCSGLFRFGRWYHPDGGWKVEIPDLFESASQNCTICSLLQKGATTYLPAEEQRAFNAVRAIIETTSCSGGVEINICFAMYDALYGHQSEARCALYATTGSVNQSITFRNIQSKQFVGSKLSRENRLKMIRGLINTCISRHESCDSFRSSLLPKRILDLFANSSSGIRVYQTHGEIAEYACLSHCWGQSKGAMLTQDALEEYQQRIDADILPRTYLDAISHCRSLGIRYLWIDSLCILQNDEQDWVGESAKMSAYYGNCVVCLAATASRDHDGGCEIDELEEISAKGIGQDGLSFDIHLGSLVANSHFWELSATSHEHDFPLLTRAWVYQERYLSPRVVHFGRTDFVFECRHTTVCECGESIKNNGYHLSGNVRSWTKTVSPGKVDTSLLAHSTWIRYARPENGSLDPWHNMIETYSQLSLTLPRDKLPAFSGIASADLTKSLPACRYLAGVREDFLIQDLLWFVGGFAPGFLSDTYLLYAKEVKSHVYVAPSWSWASVNDPVHFACSGGIAEKLCTVTKPEVLLATPAPYGEVSSGCLTVEGKLFPTSWGFTGDKEAPMSYHLWDWEKYDGNNYHAGKHFYPDFMWTNSGAYASIDSSELLYVLPLVRFNVGSNVAAIALRRIPVPGSKDGDSVPVFQRVGWVWRWGPTGSEPSTFPYEVASSIFKIF